MPRTIPLFNWWIGLCYLGLNTASAQIPLQTRAENAYRSYGVEGGMAVLELPAGTWHVWNETQCDMPLLPGSTFKIVNTLIGLETGVLPDTQMVFRWDSVQRANPNWNADRNLRQAFHYSVVWAYQHLARQIGAARMQAQLQNLAYGNASIEGGIDRFWLDGGLRITTREQVLWLRRLYESNLPYSQRSMELTRAIMVESRLNGIVRAGKTGWAAQEGYEVGWYVGWVEWGKKTWIFANMVRCPSDRLRDDFGMCRRAIAETMLEELIGLPMH